MKIELTAIDPATVAEPTLSDRWGQNFPIPCNLLFAIFL